MIPTTDREILVDIHARVKNIETRLVEIDDLDRRLNSVERCLSIKEDVDDHERRLRVVERTMHYMAGVAAAVGAVVSYVLSSLKDRFLT